jgi:hypothetical protein
MISWIAAIAFWAGVATLTGMLFWAVLSGNGK